MPYRDSLSGLGLLLTLFLPVFAHSSELDFSSDFSQSDVIVLEDMIVYGKRQPSSDQSVSVKQGLSSAPKTRLSIKGALENTTNPSVGFHIKFAPGSSVMTAQGKAKLNLIASAMELIPGWPAFEIHVDTDSQDRRSEQLAMSRARAIVAHLQLNRRLRNELIVVGGTRPGLYNRYSARSSSSTNQNVLFVNKGS